MLTYQIVVEADNVARYVAGRLESARSARAVAGDRMTFAASRATVGSTV
jgi:hypothetical protein